MVAFFTGQGKVHHNPLLQNGEASGDEQFFELLPLGDVFADIGIIIFVDHQQFTIGECL